MSVFISHKSALEYWRRHQTLPSNNALRRCGVSLPKNPPGTKDVKLAGLSLPLHVVLSDPKTRWASPLMRQHVFMGKVPVGCFMGNEEGYFVSSPEMCFLQMAGQMPLVGLIELGYELCGTYSIPVAGDPNVPERGFYYREPLMSAQSLKDFLARMPGVRGHQKAQRALRYLLDGSASPMETKLAILLTLPYKLGGFGLIQPELNSRIIPTKSARWSSSKAFYTCDLYWSDYDLAVEYDSASFHTGSKRIADDSKKRNALVLMGITVITVTTQQLYDKIEFEKIARILANCTDKRLRPKNPGFTTAHHELRNQLL